MQGLRGPKSVWSAVLLSGRSFCGPHGASASKGGGEGQEVLLEGCEPCGVCVTVLVGTAANAVGVFMADLRICSGVQLWLRVTGTQCERSQILG